MKYLPYIFRRPKGAKQAKRNKCRAIPPCSYYDLRPAKMKAITSYITRMRKKNYTYHEAIISLAKKYNTTPKRVKRWLTKDLYNRISGVYIQNHISDDLY